MDFTGLLSVVVFLPLAAGIFMALFLKGNKTIRIYVGLIALIELALTIVVFISYDLGSRERWQLIDRFQNWIP